jgi:hypothetical protein
MGYISGRKVGFIVFLFLNIRIFAQDSIRLVCGDVLPVKISEVGLKEISYVPPGHPDSTVIVSKTNINYLRFSDGELNRINDRKLRWVENSSAAGFTRIIIINKQLQYKGSWINRKELYDLVTYYPFAEGKKALAIEMAKVQRLKNKQSLSHGLIVTGWVVPLIASYIFTGAAFDETVKDGRPYIATLAAGVVVGAACRISGYILFFKSRNQLKAQHITIAETYNRMK